MNEPFILGSLLFFAFVLAPVLTNRFFLHGSMLYSDIHKTTIALLVAGVLFDFRYAMIIWPLFCIGGFAFHLLKRGLKFFLTMKGLASCIPFVFSLISSLWFVAGALDLKLLSYNPAWSFYAALHGIFLGWIFVGCLAFLTMRTGASRIYLLGCYLSFALFLCVAFGIDGVPYLKPIGVVGFSLMMPLWIAHYAFHLEKSKKLSRTFAFISLSTIVLSMTLALLNEFWSGKNHFNISYIRGDFTWIFRPAQSQDFKPGPTSNRGSSRFAGLQRRSRQWVGRCWYSEF